MPPNWQRDDAGGIFAVCDDDELDPARLTSAPVMKENKPMAEHDDAFVEELSDLLGRMSASDSRTLRKFMEAVGEQVSEVKKDASSAFLAQLKAYLASYLAELGAIPGDGNQTDATGAPRTPQFPAGPKPTRPQASSLTPALKQLAQRLLLRAVSQRGNLLAVEQDDRGLTHNPMRNAREQAAEYDMRGEKLVKHDSGARTSGGEVEQEDFSTDPCASAQAERDRVAAQRRGR
ncbi:MAG: hypothetical protein MUP14_01935 [Dehalococcoidia bacterium]|nr:hypothetical protein [Dehalococcoidia bacterium]